VDWFVVGGTVAEYASALGTAVLLYLMWASGYADMLIIPARANHWGLDRIRRSRK
jgi:hypothetical protein